MTYTGKDKVIHVVLWIIVALLLCALAAYFLYQFGVFDSREEETTEVSGTLTDAPTGTPAGTTAKGPDSHTDPAQSSTGSGTQGTQAIPGTTSRPVVTTNRGQNIDDYIGTTDANTTAVTTAAAGTSAPVDRSSAEPEGTSSPEHTTSPEIPTSPQEHTTRTPITTRDPYVTTRSPELTTVPHTNYTPDPAITIIPPTTMPNGEIMMDGDSFDDVLIAPNGDPVPGHWELPFNEPAYFYVDLPSLAENETKRGWSWNGDYHILVAGTYIGVGYGLCRFIPDEKLPPIEWTGVVSEPRTLIVESGSWW